jgi:hypothetical protein
MHPVEAALTIDIERRSGIRYPLQLGVRYRTQDQRRRVMMGVGETVDVSSSGVLVVSQHDLSAGARLEMTLEWPYQLDETIPLQLVLSVRVVRYTKSAFAVAIVQYQFRTMKRRLLELVTPEISEVLARRAG